MRTLLFMAAAGMLLAVAGCSETNKTAAGKDAKAAAPAVAPAAASTPANAAPKRRLKIDANGNAYEVLEEHERLCQNCDR